MDANPNICFWSVDGEELRAGASSATRRALLRVSAPPRETERPRERGASRGRSLSRAL